MLALGALLFMMGSDCASPCGRYRELQAECLDESFSGTWWYTGYDDREDYYAECVDLHTIPADAALQESEQDACQRMIEDFDETSCY